MYTILICDDNIYWLEVLSLAIDKDPKFKIAAQAYDGKITLDLIEKFRPDIIILDIVMPVYDGVYIVNHIRKNMKEYVPIIYILSALGTGSIVKTLNELDIDFYSMKPVSVNVIMCNLNTLIKQRGNAEIFSAVDGESAKEAVRQELLEYTVKNVLLKLGAMPHRTSSKCVTDALVLYTHKPESFSTLTKALYPQIGSKYGLSNSSVEKNIRSAISQIQRNKTEMYSEIFSYSTKERITNGEFISVMSDYISKIVKNG